LQFNGKSQHKTLLDQRPDEVTILENNVAKTIKASTAKIGDIIQLKAGEKLGWSNYFPIMLHSTQRHYRRRKYMTPNKRRNRFSRNDKLKFVK
jgi:hypothetical protein